MSSIVISILACLTYLQAWAQSSQNSLKADLYFPKTKYSPMLGPNCHGTTLAVTGLSGGLITDWHWTLDLILSSPFCTQIKRENIKYGDIGAVRISGSNSLGSDLAHSMTFLSPHQIFHKRSYLEDSPFEKSKLSSLCQEYNIAGLCPKASSERPHQYHLEIYRCKRVSYDSLELGNELDAKLRQIEAVFERMTLFKKGVSAEEHAALRGNLQLIAEIGISTQSNGPQTDSSGLFFQRLVSRRLMNIKTQLSEILRYPFSKADLSQSLDEALQVFKE